MKYLRWVIGMTLLVGFVVYIAFNPLPFLFHHKLPYINFVSRALYIIVMACMLCLFRIVRGPTAPDRIVAHDMLGVMVVGLCAVLTVTTGRTWYIDLGIAWALQSFISTLAFAKYLEGKGFED